ncbi:MAG: DNA replication/repair protein RecF [Omnitrophica WOR_2 bacterium]
MHLTHLSLTNFRNFTRLDTDLPGGAVLLVGDNAQGKTSLLEAVYFLATFVSFQASHDRELINFITGRDPLSVARIVGDYRLDGAAHRLEVRVIQEAASGNNVRLRKEALLDGVKHKISELVGKFNAVLFLPQMMGVIEGAPEERRRYLNLALGQTIPFYAEVLASYTRALSQRNALLKMLYERGGDVSQINFWDEQLAISGAQIIQARISAIQELERLAARIQRELTRGNEVLRLCYQPSYDPFPSPPGQFALPLDAPVDRSRISAEQIREGFREQLAKIRPEEVSRGMTLIGPHRDELRFMSNGIDLGTYGSRGQVRTAMLALKLAEVAWMKEKTGHWPVLLLDEVLAELDTQRRADLLSRLKEGQQALLTTTDLDLFSNDFVKSSTVWYVQAGRLREGDGV